MAPAAVARPAGVPYQPFADLLDQLMQDSPPGSLSQVLDDESALLRRLSVKVDRHRRSVEGPPGAADQRRDLFKAVSVLFARLAETRPLVLVLEDLQRAQLPSLGMLQHLASASTEARILLIATFRTTRPDRSDELSLWMADMHRLEGVRRLDLDGLDTDAIAQFVALRTGLAPDQARAAAALLRDRTGGNPFFLREMWADLERRGAVSDLRSWHRVPASISDTVEGRIAGMGEAVRNILEQAAVLGTSSSWRLSSQPAGPTVGARWSSSTPPSPRA